MINESFNRGMNLVHPLVKGYSIIALGAIITEYHLLKHIHINLVDRPIHIWDFVLLFEAFVPYLVMGLMLAANRNDTYKLIILNRVNFAISLAGTFATIYILSPRHGGPLGVLLLPLIALFQTIGAPILSKLFCLNYESRS